MMEKKYSHAAHTRRVKLASAARLGARIVLDCLCDRADFYKPQVVITKEQIQDYTGLKRKAVQRGLAFLRAEGTIQTISGGSGGRSVAVRYQLCIIAKGGADEATSGAQIDPDAVRKSQAWGDALLRIMREKGVGYGEARKLADQEIGIA